ncbi:DNA alkylation repair protein [Fusibacter bizertensis]
MEFKEIMYSLQSLGSDRMKKYYMSQGAKEPLFGAATGPMKPLAKKLKNDQVVAEKLYATGNYDAMYLAGMIANVKEMTPADFHRWMESAYFYMISDFVVAVTLAETDFAQEVADQFIKSGDDLKMSAGWSTYDWLIGSRADTEFDQDKIDSLLKKVKDEIVSSPIRTQFAMNRFLIATGVSYKPLHEKALQIAREIGQVTVISGKEQTLLSNAYEGIMKQVEKGRIGFKRKNVRC